MWVLVPQLLKELCTLTDHCMVNEINVGGTAAAGSAGTPGQLLVSGAAGGSSFLAEFNDMVLLPVLIMCRELQH